MGFAAARRNSGVTYRPTLAAWVNRNENGDGTMSKGQGNISFTEENLYSFRTPIAKYYRHGKVQFVLVSRETYSPTTNIHRRHIWSYVNVPIFEVRFIGAHGGMSREPAMTYQDMHQRNADEMWEVILELCDGIGKAFKEEQYYDYSHKKKRLEEQYDECARYCRTTGTRLHMPPLAEMVDLADKICADNRHKYYHPNAVARRERARGRAAARKAFGLIKEQA